MGNRASFKSSVQCLLFDDNERILLLKRSNTLYCDNMYALPGGHLEIGESVVEGMRRELLEEVGINFSLSELKLVKIINRKIDTDNYIDFIFKAKLNKRKVRNMEKDVCSRIIYRALSNIPKNSIPVLKKIINNDDFFMTMEE